jgi:tetrahydromethanopterin S-methyltransferase subunit G
MGQIYIDISNSRLDNIEKKYHFTRIEIEACHSFGQDYLIYGNLPAMATGVVLPLEMEFFTSVKSSNSNFPRK